MIVAGASEFGEYLTFAQVPDKVAGPFFFGAVDKFKNAVHAQSHSAMR